MLIGDFNSLDNDTGRVAVAVAVAVTVAVTLLVRRGTLGLLALALSMTLAVYISPEQKSPPWMRVRALFT
jgi:hypothetical protein